MIPSNFLLPRPRKLYHIVTAKCRPIHIDPDQVRKVLAAYDLGQLRGYRQPAIGASRSRNLILDIGGDQKILKQYKSSMSLEGITYEHSVLKHLAAHNFSSPRLIPSRGGKTCLEMDGRYYALFHFISGFGYTDYFLPAKTERILLAEAGKTLARYHQTVDGFTPAGRKLDGFMPDGQRKWQDQNWYLDRFKKYEALFKAKDEKSDLDHFFVDNLERLVERYVDLNQKVEENSSQLPRVVNHGDYGPYNLFFDKKGLVAVLDFECVHLNLRATEVITALRRFAGSDTELDYDKARIFFEAYSSICPLMASEIERMPDIFQLALLEGLTYHLRDHFESNDLLRLHYARSSVAWMDWMEKNGDDLVKFLLVWNKKGGSVRQ